MLFIDINQSLIWIIFRITISLKKYKQLAWNEGGIREAVYLVEVDVVVKRNDRVYGTVFAEPCDGVSTDREKNKSHVEF